VTVGSQRLSMTVTRKTDGDLMVSQHSSERWFATEEDATEALRQVMEAFLEYFTGTPLSEESEVRRKP
jgi:transcriptional regulator of met regulon